MVKLKIGIKRKPKPNFPPKLHAKPKNLPQTNPKPRKTFNGDDIEWIEKEDLRSGITKMSENVRIRKFNYKRRKKEQYQYIQEIM